MMNFFEYFVQNPSILIGLFLLYCFIEILTTRSTTSATGEAGTAYPSGAPELTWFLAGFLLLNRKTST